VIEHGTYSGYVHLACRCEPCVKAMRKYRSELAKRKPPVHGTSSTYRNYNCRCDECKGAWNAYLKKYRLARKR
jgi:hypothetical protein